MNGKNSTSALKLTLAILKPDVCRNPDVVQEIRKIILDNNFYFVRSTQTLLTASEAERFYQEHKNKFFFNRLVTFMSSGQISAHILAHEDAIQKWRKLMGPTRVFKAQFEEPNSLRGRFGLTDTRNATHGSDSPDSARREIQFFFPEFDATKWYREEEPFFRSKQITLDSEKWQHVISDRNKNTTV